MTIHRSGASMSLNHLTLNHLTLKHLTHQHSLKETIHAQHHFYPPPLWQRKGNAILLILAVASLAILALGIGLLIWVGV
jgi:hypothetical protein